MDDELTVLDYVKALLTPWRGAPPPIPHLEEVQDLEPADQIELEFPPAIKETDPLVEQVRVQPADDETTRETIIPWLAIVAFGLALTAQISLEPGPDRTWGIGLGLYLVSAALAIWANFKGEWRLPGYSTVQKKIDQLKVRWVYLTAGAVFSMLAFLTLGGNRFTLINILLWVSAIVFISIGF